MYLARFRIVDEQLVFVIAVCGEVDGLCRIGIVGTRNGGYGLPLTEGRDNKLQNLDASNLSKLKEFYCNNNELTDLMLNSLELTWVECQNNDLQSLDLSNLPALYLLRCYENQFETIDVSNNPELRGFFCNPMESLKTIYMSEGQDQLLQAFEKPEAAEVVYK